MPCWGFSVGLGLKWSAQLWLPHLQKCRKKKGLVHLLYETRLNMGKRADLCSEKECVWRVGEM